jgi:hypothetical protein
MGGRRRAAGQFFELVTECELEGNCRGWDGSTAFKLANGEVWRQSAWRYRDRLHLCSPAIRVWRIGAGFFLEVEGTREILPVQRLHQPFSSLKS